jgi:hypothetical protein
LVLRPLPFRRLRWGTRDRVDRGKQPQPIRVAAIQAAAFLM